MKLVGAGRRWQMSGRHGDSRCNCEQWDRRSAHPAHGEHVCTAGSTNWHTRSAFMAAPPSPQKTSTNKQVTQWTCHWMQGGGNLCYKWRCTNSGRKFLIQLLHPFLRSGACFFFLQLGGTVIVKQPPFVVPSILVNRRLQDMDAIRISKGWNRIHILCRYFSWACPPPHQ